MRVLNSSMCAICRGVAGAASAKTAKPEVRPMSDNLGNDMLERDGEDD